MMAIASDPRKHRRPPIRLVKIAAMIAGAIAGVLVLLPWLGAYLATLPRWVTRAAALGFLWVSLVLYGMAVVLTLIGIPLLARRVLQGRQRGERRPLAARALLLCFTNLFGVVLLEGSAAAWLAWAHRIPDPPTKFADDRAASKPGDATARELYIVVIGESTARGEPYNPWLSIGDILGWQLERVFSGRHVRVEILAAGGICLEQAIVRLDELKRRPDVILVCSGHNEFQARYGWSRNVRHYVEERPRPGQPVLQELLRKYSSLSDMILETIDLQHVDQAPEHASRELVDHPTCSPEERAFLLADFRRRMEAEVSYCERIGTLPILVIPASNDSGYEPMRSVLDGRVPEPERKAFALEFRAAHALESTDPSGARAAFQSLIARYPGFAESHFRLARLLERAGEWEQARDHYTRARDFDGMPMRCPTDFENVYRRLATRDSRVLLVDGPAVLRAQSAHGILSDHHLHDAAHPTLLGYIAMTQDLLRQLHDRHAFGWPAATPTPTIDPVECASHFGIDQEKWSEVCNRSAFFYARTGPERYDPSDRYAKAHRYDQAAKQIAAGTAPEDTGMPGVGCRRTEPRDGATNNE